MFEHSSIMLANKENGELSIYKLDTNTDTQTQICRTFSRLVNESIICKEEILFNGNYKPDDGEILYINNFSLHDKIQYAIREPISIPSFKKYDGCFPVIDFIFVGEKHRDANIDNFKIVFQNFKKNQYISRQWYNLFFDNSTFFQEKRFGFSIKDCVDCYYESGKLKFSSFYQANQIFDLKGYYRVATDVDINNFISNKIILVQNSEAFKNMSDLWIRRRIAAVNDSEILRRYTANKIHDLAMESGISINIQDNKIIIPNQKYEIKIILGFLNEEAYKGPFSQNTYLANSRRKLE